VTVTILTDQQPVTKMYSPKLIYDGIAQSVQRLATGWTVRGSIPVGARFSAPVQTGSGAYPAFCTKGTGCFPVGKATGAWR